MITYVFLGDPVTKYRTGRFIHSKFISHSSGVWMSETRMPVWLGFGGEGHLPGSWLLTYVALSYGRKGLKNSLGVCNKYANFINEFCTLMT
jgi:hypothetical protein